MITENYCQQHDLFDCPYAHGNYARRDVSFDPDNPGTAVSLPPIEHAGDALASIARDAYDAVFTGAPIKDPDERLRAFRELPSGEQETWRVVSSAVLVAYLGGHK